MKKLSWHSSGITDKGTVRQRNEDNILIKEPAGLWVVADGAGGHTDGHLASRLLITELNKLTPVNRLGTNTRKIIHLLRNANTQLINKRRQTGEISGSTASIFLTDGKNAVCLWSGDSPMFRMRNGVLIQLNLDHNRTEEFLKQGFTLEECERIPYAQQLIQALGATDILGLQTRLVDLKPNDHIIICSDGLTKAVSLTDIHKTITINACNPETMTQSLLAQALGNKARDNVSVISIHIHD